MRVARQHMMIAFMAPPSRLELLRMPSTITLIHLMKLTNAAANEIEPRLVVHDLQRASLVVLFLEVLKYHVPITAAQVVWTAYWITDHPHHSTKSIGNISTDKVLGSS